MIERVWKGWIHPDKLESYKEFLQNHFFRAAHEIPGYVGARMSYREAGDEIEVLTVIYFESVSAIRAFAGDDYEAANVSPEARDLLSHWDKRVTHYEALFQHITDVRQIAIAYWVLLLGLALIATGLAAR